MLYSNRVFNIYHFRQHTRIFDVDILIYKATIHNTVQYQSKMFLKKTFFFFFLVDLSYLLISLM